MLTDDKFENCAHTCLSIKTAATSFKRLCSFITNVSRAASAPNVAMIALGLMTGLQGEIRIDKFGDVQRKRFLFTVKDGRFVTLE